MHKHIKLALFISICCLIVTPFISATAFKSMPQLEHGKSALESSIHTLTITSNMLNNVIQFRVAFPEPVVEEIVGYHSVSMQDLLKHGAPGEPVLPFVTIKAAIPLGKGVSNIDVTPSIGRPLEGNFEVEYGKTPIRISSKPTVTDEPNQEIYNSAEAFPETLCSEVSYHYFRGFEILHITVNPVQYFPKTYGLSYFETVTVTIDLYDSNKHIPLLRGLPGDKIAAQRIVDNPEAIETYDFEPSTLQRTSIINSSESYDYVIITNAALNSSFQPLIESKIQKGLNATTVLVEDILTDPDYFCDGIYGDGCGSEFNDTAAKVRNFIKDAYLNWGTEYVLLGGDVGIIQHRGVYGFVATQPITQDQNMPSDMYFGALDGSWDNDNDTIFGEGVYDSESDSPQNGTAGEEVDWYSEVYIGRAPVGGITSAQNFVNKTLWYEQATDDSYFRKALMIGENLDEETEAANSKDVVSGEIPQYTTTRLYERDGTYSGIVNAINTGVHILNHDGHCNANSMMGLSKTGIDTLIVNTENFFFGYSVGCYAAAFDGDSVVEHFVRSPNGSFAFISNSRYGWYMPGTLVGTGDVFDRQFFIELNSTDRHIGKTLQLSKEHFAGDSMGDSFRWTYVELNLLGDPEIELVTEIQAPTAHIETNPSAARLSPAIVKGVVNLTGIARRGTAPSTSFSNYTIEYYQSGWHTTGISLVNNGQNEVTNDLLATWDTNIVGTGEKTLRLLVTDSNGSTGEDRWVVKVEQIAAIRVEPQLAETYEGLDFTVSVKITDPEDLYGLDFQLMWNTTFVDYVSHEVYIPVDTFLWGVLYSPVQIIADSVNGTAGTYRIAAKSTSWTPTENDGLVFNMTFNAKNNGTFSLEIFASNLTNRDGLMKTHKTVDGLVLIEPGIHDIAALSIATDKTVVGEGYGVRVYVTIENEGTFVETFNFTIYANATAINTTQVSLPTLSQTILTIQWDTTSIGKGNYTISVQVEPVENETDTIDNNSTSTKEVCVTIPGDVDATFNVNIFDIVKIAGSYMKTEGDPGFDPNSDIDGSGIINIFDIVIACNNYMQSWP